MRLGSPMQDEGGPPAMRHATAAGPAGRNTHTLPEKVKDRALMFTDTLRWQSGGVGVGGPAGGRMVCVKGAVA